jgi:DNA-binding NtrC family response regulator
MSIANELLLNPRMLKDVQILVVDNDRDTRDLYAFLLESYGAKVTALGSIKDALDLLAWYRPAILICEMRFLGESVHPLLQRVKYLAPIDGKPITILITSTCSPTSLVQQLQVKVEAFLRKPIDIDCFVNEVWNLTLLPSFAYPPSIQDWVAKQAIDKTSRCIAEVS